MEEIKVNDFIRTKDGYIGKITNVGDEFSYDYIYQIGNVKCAISRKKIAKHSFNIIDLIECGDYVNGHLVTAVDRERLEVTIENMDWDIAGEDLKGSEIKEVVTKEYFDSIKYEVK